MSVMMFVALCTLFAPAGAGDYLNEWAVHVEKGDGAAMRVAKDHGFANLGQVRLQQCFNCSCFRLVRATRHGVLYVHWVVVNGICYCVGLQHFSSMCARASHKWSMEIGRLLNAAKCEQVVKR
jgi:hypothetical protein